jgi:hypothetical protein
MSQAVAVCVLGLFHYIGWRKEMWRRITWFRRRVKEEAEFAKGFASYGRHGDGSFPRNMVKLKSQEDGTGPLSWHSTPRTTHLDGAPSGRPRIPPPPPFRSPFAAAESHTEHAQHAPVVPPRTSEYVAQSVGQANVLPARPPVREPQRAEHAHAAAPHAEGRGRRAVVDDELYRPPNAATTHKMAEAARHQAYKYVRASGFDGTDLVDERMSCLKQCQAAAAWAAGDAKLMKKSRETAAVGHTAEVAAPPLAAMAIPPRPEARPQPQAISVTPVMPVTPYQTVGIRGVVTWVYNAVAGVGRLACRVGHWAEGVLCSIGLRVLLYVCYAILCARPGTWQHMIIRWLWWLRNRNRGGLDHAARKDDPAYTAAMKNEMPFAFFVEVLEDQFHVKVHACPSLLDALWPKGSSADAGTLICSRPHNLVVGASAMG